MSEFPAHVFRMEGDSSAIHSSATKWTSFGAAATEASAQITQLDTAEFVGPEGDQFRDGLNKDMPEHLRITGDAFSKVSTALNRFAGTLDSLQDQMRPLAQRAPALWQAVQAAQGRADRAHQDDQRHEREMAARPPDSTEPDTYRSDTGSATAALSQAQREWEDCLNQANGLRASLTGAVRDCVGQIRQAKDSTSGAGSEHSDRGNQMSLDSSISGRLESSGRPAAPAMYEASAYYPGPACSSPFRI